MKCFRPAFSLTASNCRNNKTGYNNPIVKKFANIVLRGACSPMGANIALLHYFYDGFFDKRLHVNEQSICKLHKLHSDSEQYATVGVLRYLLKVLTMMR